MPVELMDFVAKRERKLAVPINDEGDTLDIRWNPTAMTPEVYAAIQDLVSKKGETQEEVDPFEAARVVIHPLMTFWDITNGGVPYPVTVENIANLGLPFVMTVASAIQADLTVSADTKKG